MASLPLKGGQQIVIAGAKPRGRPQVPDAMRKWLIIAGLVLVLAGLFWPLLGKLGLGRLPGDIVIHKNGVSFYFPITTMVLASIVLTIIFRFLNK